MSTTAKGLSRRGIAFSAFVATALGLGVLGFAGPAAAANTGGCNPQTRGPFKLSACVSKPNFATVNADGYLTAKPAGCFDIRIDIRDKYGNMAKAGNWQSACNTGHYVGASLGFWDNNHNGPWYSEFTIVQGSTSYVVDSPYVD